MSITARLGTHSAASLLPRGAALLRDPLLNKGTAFNERERNALGLRGLLPAHVLTLEEQAARVITNLQHLPDDLQKYVALNALHDRNETLFFRVVVDHIDEIQPRSIRRPSASPVSASGTFFSGPADSALAQRTAVILRSCSATGRYRRG